MIRWYQRMIGLAACVGLAFWVVPAEAQEIADTPAYEIPEDYQPEEETGYEVEAPTHTQGGYDQVERRAPAEPYYEPAPYEAAPPEPPQVEAADDYYHVLAPYGRFYRTSRYGLIWVPRRSVVGSRFVPYMSAGNWVQSNHGLMFVSDWNWGWLPFHYGRWFRHPRHGWAWVHRAGWSPAWVHWRHGGGYVGWVPQPPRSVALPHRYWAFASPHRMVQGRAWRRHLVPRRRWRAAMHQTRPWRHRARLHHATYYRSPRVRISGAGVVRVAPPSRRGSLYRLNVRNGRATFQPWRRRRGGTVVHTGPGGRVKVRTTRGGRTVVHTRGPGGVQVRRRHGGKTVVHTGRGGRATVRTSGPGGVKVRSRRGAKTVVHTGRGGAVKIKRRGRHGAVTTTVRPGGRTVVKRTRRGPRGAVQEVSVTKRRRKGGNKAVKVKVNSQGGKKRRRRSQ